MKAPVAILCLGLASGSAAQTGPDCAAMTKALGALDGYALTAPPAGPVDGWCVLDGATLRSTLQGWPNLSVDRLRLHNDPDASPLRIEADLTGLRITPQIGDRAIDDRLRALMRLQTADLRLDAVRNDAENRLELRSLVLRLSGGTEVVLSADVRGAGLDPASFLAGSVTRLDLQWRSDGRMAGPVMELAGEQMVGVGGGAAVDAARGVLAGIVAALPDAALTGGSRAALEALVADLPQGRGRLQLALVSEGGIGAARLALAAMSGDPLGPKALSSLLQDARIDAMWMPGLAP